MLSVVKLLGFLGKINETFVSLVANLALARYVYSNQNNNTMLRYIASLYHTDTAADAISQEFT